jgi:predicted neuraminidase
MLIGWTSAILCSPAGSSRAEDRRDRPEIIRSEFVYESAPFPQCHASTIVETGGGFVAAWFGGTAERNPDVGIWVARHDGKAWSVPEEVARGERDGIRLPCWNPVLFQPSSGPLLLFYKVGPDPRHWWGMLTTSTDHGKSWSAPSKLPEGILGPIKNKPIQRPNGEILCPSSSEDKGWRVHFERTRDLGRTWERIGPVDGKMFDAIQPSILTHADGRLQVLCRSRQSRIVESWSADGGTTWTELSATALPNPSSGTDAVTLADGRQLLVYNHTEKGRSPLNVAVSADGRAWRAALVLEDEPGEFSYPAVIQSSDGLVHITYTWNRRRIRHVILDPKKLVLREIVDGRWPSSDPSTPPTKTR